MHIYILSDIFEIYNVYFNLINLFIVINFITFKGNNLYLYSFIPVEAFDTYTIKTQTVW